MNNLNNPPPLPIKPSSENKTRRTWGGALPGECIIFIIPKKKKKMDKKKLIIKFNSPKHFNVKCFN